jgi:hypothetical protein
LSVLCTGVRRFGYLIDGAERTAVQTTVKRADG